MSRRSVLVSGMFVSLSFGCRNVDVPDDSAAPPPDAEPDPRSLSAVIPSTVFAGRGADVVVSGEGTSWTSDVEVDFGEGVVVSSVTVASPSALLVEVDVDATAAPGSRDVSVSTDGEVLVYRGAFKVAAALAAYGQGSLESGSIVAVHANQLDPMTPFDTTMTGDGLFSPLSFPYLTARGGDGVELTVTSAEPYSADLLAMIDVGVKGVIDLAIDSGNVHPLVTSVAPAALTIEAREPTAVVEGTTYGDLVDAYESRLLSFTPEANRRVRLEVESNSFFGSPEMFVLPISGRFADRLGEGRSVLLTSDSADPLYVVIWDPTGAMGYSFGLSVATFGPEVDEIEPNGSCAEAMSVEPSSTIAATLASAEDADWYKFETYGGDAHLWTSPGDDFTDTVLDVIAADCQTVVDVSLDWNYHEDLTVPDLAAGVYYVRVRVSDWGYYGASYLLDVEVD